MPFKSEAQRKYLWANEPAIARDWTDTYGSRIKKDDGGIMRVGLKKGSSRQPGIETSNLGQTGKSTTGGKSRGDLQRDIKNLGAQMKGKDATAQDYVNVYADPSRLDKNRCPTTSTKTNFRGTMEKLEY